MEHLYRINLNKGEDKAARIAQQLEMQRWALVVVFAVLGAVVSGFAWNYNNQLDDMIADRQAQIEDIKAELHELQDTGSKLSKVDIMNLAKLEKSRLQWTRKIMGLAMESTRDMALTSVRFEKGLLYILGVHKVREGRDPIEEVMDFVEQLKANKLFNQDFVSVQFANSADIISHDQPALSFEIHCKIMPGFLNKDIKLSKES